MTSQRAKSTPATLAVTEQAEQESPVLNRIESQASCYDHYRASSGNVWACVDKLDNLFQLSGAKRIVFVAKRRADSGTYKASVGLAGGRWKLAAPIRAELCRSLGRWLQSQIQAGRPNIGVRILASKGDHK